MSLGTTTADARHSVEATLNILRRLLDEESLILSQLTYVVAHIHDPLLEGCKPVDPTGKGIQKQQQNGKKGDIKIPAILTFAQYWELFANIATLTEAQSTLVGKLESAITYSTSILEQQDEKLKSKASHDGERINTSGRSLSNNRKKKEEEEKKKEKAVVSGDSNNNNNNNNSSSVGDVDVLQIIPEIFCSAAMRHYVAEHMMYSLNYTRNIAPRVLQLWRLWRARLDKHINAEERQQLTLYGRFLHFLWDTMGRERGVPDDPRVVCTRLPETPPTNTNTTNTTTSANNNNDNNHSHNHNSNNHNNNNNNNNNNTIKSSSSSSFQALVNEPPPIPRDWRGFETLLVLLATPLASLRRYMHVARCLVESRFLRKTMRTHLQSEFVDVVALRLAEEGSIVLDELARQDVEHIIALIDESAVSPLSAQPPFASSTVAPSLSSTLNNTMGTATISTNSITTNNTITTTNNTNTNTNTTAGTPISMIGPGGKKCPRIPPDLDGSRTLIHYGHLTKRFRRGRHERLLFLFSDLLCYVEELTNGRMRLRASIALETIKVVELDDTADAVNAFDIVTNESRLTFFAPTPEQKHQWVDALRSTVMAYVKKTKKWAAEANININTNTIEGTAAAAAAAAAAAGVLGQQQQQQQLQSLSYQQKQQSGDVVRLISATAPPLPHNSRLQRQRRVDQVRQERLLMRRLSVQSNTNATITTNTNTTTNTAATLTTFRATSHIEPSPASVTSGSSDKRRRAFSWRSPHGNFDVTHWAQQSTDTVHRRVRSTDFLSRSWTPQSPYERSTGDIEILRHHNQHNQQQHPPLAPPSSIPSIPIGFSAFSGEDDNNSPSSHHENNTTTTTTTTTTTAAGVDTPGKPPRTPMMRLMSERFQEQSSFNSAEKSPCPNTVSVFQQEEEQEEEEENGEEENKVLLPSSSVGGEKSGSSMKREASVDVSRFSTDDVLTIERELREGEEEPVETPTKEKEEEGGTESNNTDTNSNCKDKNDNISLCESRDVQFAPTHKKETEE
ncbi:uncharacterized protein TM35_000311780 [Trypanosoma theileri]|uniref:PH domain-containing protein n=1 Tax=Trypanosoma theileri TaxID=67003 RepID=A0A1X0NMM1_9TRYP|nr:uncharacterized protein TM35_000311780 [Trypanosoma theileri]ORC85992.1 hypothetical protein TM35_000311780 [Trypanosoma theileri]